MPCDCQLKGNLLQQIKVTLADSSKDSKYGQHPLPPIKQVALSPVFPFTKMKIALALQTPSFNKTTETWGVYCSLYKDRKCSEDLGLRLWRFKRKRPCLSSVIFFYSLKSRENSLYMNTLNQSLRRFPKADTRFWRRTFIGGIFHNSLSKRSRLYLASCMSHSQLSDFLNIFSRLDPVFLPVTWEANILWVWPALELQLELLWWHTSGRYHIYFTCFSVH